MFSKKLLTLISTIALAILVQSCDNAGCLDQGALNYDPEATEDSGNCDFPELRLGMNINIGTEALVYNNVYTIGGVAVSFSNVSFYVSNPRVMTDGVGDQTGKYLLVKAGEAEYDLGEITAGHKHMLMFEVGVDSVTNHANPETYEMENPLSFQSPSMHWSWDNGYIFVRIDGMVDTNNDGTPDETMEFHIGKDSNLKTIAFEVHQEVDTKTELIELDVDVATFFNGIDLSTDYVTHTGDFPDLANAVVANITSMFSLN
ncbi:MAG: MbnP family protein [Bacteroidota bacterium]